MTGGFGYGAAGRVVAGEGREAVTGAVPLYINDAHWAVAQLRARPLLGYMVSLTPLVRPLGAGRGQRGGLAGMAAGGRGVLLGWKGAASQFVPLFKSDGLQSL